MTPDLDHVRQLDADDRLSGFREHFQLPEGEIYLDGNSLGPMPKTVPERLQTVVTEEWAQDLIRSWNSNDWIHAPRRIGAKIARLIGADDDEVICSDSTSVNIFKALSAAVQMRPGRGTILSERGNFPTDAYMMEGLAALSGGRLQARLVDRDAIRSALDDDVAVLLLTHTHYKTGALWDMQDITRLAREADALIIWDLSHSAGAMPVHLNDCNADFAVGCGYKYLNGGPGAPAFLFAARQHHNTVFPALSGWLGHKSPFAFDDHYTPAPGIDRFQCGTPGILGMAALECGLDLISQADLSDIRRKSQALGDLFIQLIKSTLPEFEIVSPIDASVRGSQVAIAHPQGYEIMQTLIDRGVIGDFRAPDILRFGFTPLYTRFEDVWQAVAVLRSIMAEASWKDPRFSIRSAVT